MIKLTKQKGITLIALIITIIVMLILVAVTINVALNGGLFTKAKNATNDTQKEVDKEELLSAVVSAYDAIEGTINETELRKIEARGWTITKNGDNTYTCQSPKGNVFTIDSKGNITNNSVLGSTETNEEDLDYVKTFFLGEKDATTGERPKNKDLQTLFVSTQDFSFMFTDANIKFDFYYDEGIANVRYKTKGYKVTFDATTGYAVDVEYLDSSLPQRVGKYVKFGTESNELWVVLYDEGEKTQGAQLINANTLEAEGIYLGDNINIIDWTDSNIISSAEIDGESGLTNIEKAMYSYNNAITILNNLCTDLVGTKTGVINVRCLGSDPINPNSENTEKFIASSETIEGYSGTWFPDNLNLIERTDTNNKPYYIAKKDENSANPEEYIIKNEDEHYISDITRLEKMAYLIADNRKAYWLNSRGFWWIQSDQVRPGVRYANGGIVDTNFIEDLWYVYRDGTVNASSGHYGVRPVVTLNSGVLSNAILSQLNSSNDGSVEKPYIIQ